MKLRDLVALIGASPSGGRLDVDVLDVTRDTRAVRPGWLLVAVAGERFDAHDVVGALAPDAAGVLLGRPVPVPHGLGWGVVADPRRALGVAAAAVHGAPSSTLPVVAVTGTNGKTTVTTLLQQAVQATGGLAGRVGTTGVQLGDELLDASLTTPEAPELQRLLRRMRDAGAELAAIEASSIGLVQHRLAGCVAAVAVFTMFGRDHLDFHGDMDTYAAAKATLFTDHLRAPGGAPRALLNADDPAWRAMRPPADRWLYGHAGEADVRVLGVASGPEGARVDVDLAGRRVHLRTPLVGSFNVHNAVAALAAGVLAGIDPDRMVEGLAVARGAPGRMQTVPNDHGVTVLVDYAHTHDALDAVLRVARGVGAGRLWVVFGCGGDRDRSKRPLMGAAAAAAADEVVVTSDNPRSEDPTAIIAEVLAGIPAGRARVEVDRRAAIELAVTGARRGDVVVIAGKGHERTQDIGGVLHPFDDAAVAAKALAGRGA